MLNDWRNRWGYEFPFYFVQLTSFASNDWQPDGSNEPDWAEFRDVQLQMSLLNNTGMAVTIDLGEPNNIHPANKQDVAYSLALIALANTYNQPIVSSGPVYESMEIEGNKVILSFNNVCDGLKSKDGPLQEFTIAGKDEIFVPAHAVIKNKRFVVVWSEKIKTPVAVRYGWKRCPIECNLYNSVGLPASPFRTDNFPLTSKDNK